MQTVTTNALRLPLARLIFGADEDPSRWTNRERMLLDALVRTRSTRLETGSMAAGPGRTIGSCHRCPFYEPDDRGWSACNHPDADGLCGDVPQTFENRCPMRGEVTTLAWDRSSPLATAPRCRHGVLVASSMRCGKCPRGTCEHGNDAGTNMFGIAHCAVCRGERDERETDGRDP